jgi:hypothetical protein
LASVGGLQPRCPLGLWLPHRMHRRVITKASPGAKIFSATEECTAVDGEVATTE